MTNPSTDGRAPVLVVGGTGKTGRRVVERLRARAVPVRVGSRTGSPPLDWDDTATWGPALQGVGAAYVTYYPDLAAPGAAATVEAFTRLATDHGVDRMVLLSGRGEEEAQRSEEAFAKVTDQWTVVRASWFCQNFSEGFAADLIRAGEVCLPAGDVPEPFVDADDLADVVVAALTERGHAHRVYEVTGRRMLTFAEAVAEVAQARGREVRYVPVPLDVFAGELRHHGESDEVVDLLRYLFGEVLDGRNAHLTDGVEQALGRLPRDFGDFARSAATTGVWDA